MDDTPLPAPPPAPAEEPAPTPAQAKAQRSLVVRLLLALAVLAGVVALLAGGVVGGGRWLLFNETGTRWLLARLPNVEVQGLTGALLGDRLQADRVRITWAGGTQSLTLDGVVADGMRWQWRPLWALRGAWTPEAAEGTWLMLNARRLAARKAVLDTGPPSGRPPSLPASLALPLQLTLGQAEVGEFVFGTQPPLQQLKIDWLVLDSRAGARHAVQHFEARWRDLALQGELQVGHAAPLTVQATATFAPALDGEARRWAAVVRAHGPAERLAVSATLRGVPRAGRDAPSIDLSAEVLPLQAWPVAALSMQTAALDLSAIDPAAPQTRLSGSAEVTARAADAPVTARLRLDNTQPGRWNEGRLPVSRVELDLGGRIDQPDRLELTRFDIALADAMRSAGRWTGRARWQGRSLTLDTQLVQVTPQRLDSRVAAMTLSGPVTATVRGLRSPDPAASATSAASAASAASTARGNANPPPQPLQAQFKLDLDGLLDGAPQPVKLLLEGTADTRRLELKRLRAVSGAATAELSGLLQRTARGEWTLATTGSLVDFDPLPWFPGNTGSAWRQGPHRVSAGWQFDLRLPADAARLAPLALAQRVAGNGSLRVHESLLAGVPLQGEVTLSYAQPTAGAGAGTLHADMRLGGNQLLLDGRGDPAGTGQTDHWQAELKADNVATLAPLAKLDPALTRWTPRRGIAIASVSAEGRWPDLRTAGSARLQQLQLGTLQVARGQADWTLDTRGDQPLDLTVDLSGLQQGEQRADQLRATLRGTLAEHRLQIDGALPLTPPPVAGQVLGFQAQAGTRAQLQAQGTWTADPAGGGRWRAAIDRLRIGAWDGGALLAPAAAASTPAAASSARPGPAAVPTLASDTPTWVDARDLRVELQFNADRAPVALRAQAGSLRLADTATLRWEEVRVDMTGERAQIHLRADIEPFDVVPLLARAQPDLGWAGNLRLSARVQIQATEKFDADLVFERTDGDLLIVGKDGVQALGVNELRAAMAAHEGQWNFTLGLMGRSLGELRGQARVQTTPAQRWPAPDAPLEGALSMQVADIGIWNAWVPAGWRVAGELRGNAALSGRFEAPQYTGEVTGNGLGLRNLLQGVNVGDGRLVLRLAGDTARVETFTLRGGDGTITVTGGANLGKAPAAQLQLKAERFRLLGRVDRQIITSGTAALALTPDQLRLNGNLKVDEGLYDASSSNAPSLDDDVSVRRVVPAEEKPVDEPPPKPRRNIVVSLDVDLGNNLRIRGRGLDTELHGRLRLTTPGGRLAVDGTISAEGGNYAAYGQKLEIERGIVAFSGPPDNPRLDVLALRPNIDMRVGVAITGSLLTPRVRLYSDPELSDNEKLSWLVLGRAPDGLGRTDTALLQRAAIALLSGEGEAPTDTLLRNMGIDELSVRQGSDTDVRETVITLGKQLSRRWYLGYERGVNATTGTFQLIYRIAQRFTLRAQSGLENSLDVIWVWRVGESPVQPPQPDGSVRKSVVPP